MSGSRDRPGPPSFEIPDLELPPAEPRRSSSTLRAVMPPESESVHGLELELELREPISRDLIPGNYLKGPAFEEDDELSLEPNGRAFASLNIAPEGSPQWPTGTPPDRRKLALDPLEIRLLAAYGAAPSLGIFTPIYALRVHLRKRALLRSLREIASNLAEAEARRDEVLAALAARLRPELEQSESFRQVLSGLSELDARAQGGDEAEVRLRAGLADVGRAVMAARTGVSVDAATVRALREADALVLGLVKSSELHLRALDAFDAEKVRAGYAWLGSGTFLMLAYCLYRFFS